MVGDGDVPFAQALCEELGPPFRYASTARTGDYGHSQCNWALHDGGMTADVLVGQDDDDIFLPRAFEVIRGRVPEPPHLIAMQAYTSSGLTPHNGNWDGHCVVVPNIKGKIGRYGRGHSGDQDFVSSTSGLWGGNPNPFPEIISMVRPKWRLWDWEVRSPEQVEALRRLRNECREFMTYHREEISPEQQQQWWSTADHDHLWCYLYTEGDNQDYLGFSVVKRREGRMYVTWGLSASARGRRLGYDLGEHTLSACQGDAYGNLLESNGAVWHIDQKCGFVETSRKDGIIECHRKWPVP